MKCRGLGLALGCVLSILSETPLLAQPCTLARGAYWLNVNASPGNRDQYLVQVGDQWICLAQNGLPDPTVTVALIVELEYYQTGGYVASASNAEIGKLVSASLTQPVDAVGYPQSFLGVTSITTTTPPPDGYSTTSPLIAIGAGTVPAALPPCIAARAPVGGGRRAYIGCSCAVCEDDPCCGNSPILIDLDGGGFKLTGSNDPVRFDLNANGSPEATGWTDRGARTAFLVLDLDGDGTIGSGRELFGNYSPMPDGTKAPNGYVALAIYDDPALGGNGDGRISAADAIYSKLQLWIDSNHNGRTDTGELSSLEEAGVESIGLRYHEEKKVDRWGNAFKYRSRATLVNDRSQRRHVETYDIYFVRVQGQ